MNRNLKYQFVFLKVILMVIAVFYFGKISLAIEPPVLTCANVNPDGSITFEWETSTDPTVEGYEIWKSDDNFIVDLPGVGTNTYIYNGLDANAAQWCFYMYSYSNGGTEYSAQSEVTCTIHIEVSNSVPMGYAQIDILGAYTYWSDPPNEIYALHLKVDSVDFGQVEYIPINYDVLHYEVIDCEANYEFFVFLTGSNCISNRVDMDFEDSNPPPPPFITSMSLDSTNQNVNFEWSMPTLNDEPSMANLGGYVVFYFIPGTNTNIIQEIIYDTNVMEYSFPTESADLSSFTFAVAAFDYCEIIDPDSLPNLTPGYESQTVFLENPTLDCDYIVLKWLPYVGWGGGTGWQDAFGPGSYEILMSENGQPDVSLGNNYLNSISLDGIHFTDTIYNLSLDSDYTFKIKAHSTLFEFSATSNSRVVNLLSLAGPERTYLGSASVVAPDEIEIIIKTDSTFREHNYVIQKRQETDDVYQDLVTLANASENFMTYLDNDDIESNKFSYEYRVAVINYCGDTVGMTNSARTILTNTTKNDFSIFNSIYWSPYDEFDYPINEYKLYRSNFQGELGEEIAITPNNTNSYIDYLEESALETNGFFCYTVVASETPGNIHNYQGESYSNQVCSQFEPLIYIPNAFVVGGGNNDVFAPVINLADYNNYSLEIFSRSGNLIFISKSYYQGWDGINNGSEVADGAYIYRISIKDGEGKLHEKTGMIFKLSD